MYRKNVIKKTQSIVLCLVFIVSAVSVVFVTLPNSTAETLYPKPYEYYTYPEMTSLLHNLSEMYPDIMNLSSLGKTYEGRDIWLVTLSDNPSVCENEPGVLLMGAHHGNEKPSYEVLIFFISYCLDTYGKEAVDNDGDGLIDEDIIDGLDNDGDALIDEDPSEKRVQDVLDATQLNIVPMVNPDGVAYDWRKNRAPNYGSDGTSETITSIGVDLNRNYGYMWNIVNLFPENYYFDWITNDESWVYRGEAPFCENESQAIKQLADTHDISISLSYHDYGEFMLFPWMHTSRHTPHESLFRSIGENMSRINKYDLRIYGQYGEREYLIPRYQGTPGSSENWLYGEHEILAFTMELCRMRTERHPDRVFDTCWKHVGVNLYVCERAQNIEEEKKYCEHQAPDVLTRIHQCFDVDVLFQNLSS